jgi:hypothetical protein
MRTILVGILIALMNFSVLECNEQTSQLPKEMPRDVKIQFNRNGGMTYAFTKIEIANQTITVEEKNASDKTPSDWSAEISYQEQENLYQLFVKNKFDTIKNDKREGIVYDAGSEAISINAGAFFNISNGLNSPLSGNNLKRYTAIADAIQELGSRYKVVPPKTVVGADFAVFEYNAQDYGFIFKTGKETKLSDSEIAQVKNLVKKAVDEYNSKQKDAKYIIQLDPYKFQFLPVLNEKGEKEVWTNCFCAKLENWQTRIVHVNDGGKCFFQLYINLTKKSFDRLSVNGDA